MTTITETRYYLEARRLALWGPCWVRLRQGFDRIEAAQTALDTLYAEAVQREETPWPEWRLVQEVVTRQSRYAPLAPGGSPLATAEMLAMTKETR